MALKIVAAILFLVATLSACGEEESSSPKPDGGTMQWDAPPEMTIDTDTEYLVTVETTHGTMSGRLFPDAAPHAVNNFVFLAKQGYFDGLVVHRIVKGFVLQSGDPTGIGTGGPGYTIEEDPIPSDLNYVKGTFAMANKGTPGSGGSQFFITLDDLTGRLPKQYALFGVLDEGLDTVDKINDVETNVGPSGEKSSPAEDVRILKVTVEERS